MLTFGIVPPAFKASFDSHDSSAATDAAQASKGASAQSTTESVRSCSSSELSKYATVWKKLRLTCARRRAGRRCTNDRYQELNEPRKAVLCDAVLCGAPVPTAAEKGVSKRREGIRAFQTLGVFDGGVAVILLGPFLQAPTAGVAHGSNVFAQLFNLRCALRCCRH